MTKQRLTHANFLQGSLTLIENALAAPEIARAIAGYGYDAARLGAGKALWTEVDALYKKQALEAGGKVESTQELEKALDKANAAYMKSLKVARLAFADDAKAITALKLLGSRKQTVAGWLEQADTFYSNLASDPKLREKMARFGFGGAKLEAEAALMEEVRRKSQAKAQGAGSAQSATAARDRKVRELDNWVSELRTICRLALYENPQELEKLGFLVLNSPRKTKKAAETSAAT